MRRRQFILLFCRAAITLPRVALAQKPDRVRRIGVLMGISESDPENRGWVATFVEELARLGWIDGRNARIERRWTNADIKRTSALAKELLAGPPDVILAVSTPATAALHRETSIVPIVFVPVSDPVGAGFVASLARPGGNITGFMNADGGLGGKWLGLLKEIAPGIKRAGILFNPDTAPGGGDFYLGSFEAAARALAVEPVTMRVRSDAEIEAAIAALGRERAGLVMMDDSFMAVHYASFPRRLATTCRRSRGRRDLSGTAASCHMERITRIFSAARPVMSIASCAARNRPTYPCKRRRNS